MACEIWQAKLDAYLDGELPSEEMRLFDGHVRSCSSCALEALGRVQTKRSVQAAGKRFTPSAEFRNRMQKSLAAKPRRSYAWGWMTTTAAVALIAVAALLLANRGREQARTDHIYGEVADLHVAALAGSSPVDVVSTDRHTVKPWFQGKIPFAFDLPELQNSEFSLLGGRMTYLDQAPGAHLIYQVRKHEISVFIFREDSSSARLDQDSAASRRRSFSLETWSQGGLRYFVVGDAAPSDIDGLARLFKAAKV